ncbi:uncharacterized protein METZ01_LOCUS355202, partial [marine metagenome]
MITLLIFLPEISTEQCDPRHSRKVLPVKKKNVFQYERMSPDRKT